MGKFFDAMQRAANPLDEPPKGGTRSSGIPELDDALLTPEEMQTNDVFPDLRTPEPLDSGSLDSSEAEEANSKPVIQEIEAAPTIGSEQILGAVPATDVDSANELSVANQPFSTAQLVDTGVFRSPAHAAYERIIQGLVKYRRTQRDSVVLFTSAAKGEGTSTVARKTALALGGHESEQVLLIDANLRTPTQHVAFGLQREVGLSDVLMGVVPLTSAIKGEGVSELAVMTAGSKVPSPAQLLTATALQSVFVGLLSLYDWIIIDGPSATSFPDSLSIAAACGGAVLVIEAEETRSEVVEEAKRALESTGVDMLGAILNRRRYHIPGFIYKRL